MTRIGTALGVLVGFVVVALLVSSAGADDMTLGRSVCARHGERFNELLGRRRVLHAVGVRCLEVRSVGAVPKVTFPTYRLDPGGVGAPILILVFVACALAGALLGSGLAHIRAG